MTEDPNTVVPPGPPGGRDKGKRLFWVALIVPPVLSLSALGLGAVSSDASVTLGFLSFFVGGACSLYCGIWLAKRWFKNTASKVIGSIVMFAVLGMVNIILCVAGCAAGVNLH